MSFRAFVRDVEAHSRTLGIPLSMSRLRDAIARACYNRPYQAAIAAENQGKLAPLELPPQYLVTTAEVYGIDLETFRAAFEMSTTDAGSGEVSPAILRARSLDDAMRQSAFVPLKRIRGFLRNVTNKTAAAHRMSLGTVAGMAAAIAKLAPELLDRRELRIAVFCRVVGLSFDQGRAYQLINGYLDEPRTLHVDVIEESMGPMFDDLPHMPEHASELASYLSGLEPARFFTDRDSYSIRREKPDLVFTLFPDWVDDVDTIRDFSWIDEAMDAQVPILGMGYDMLQADLTDLALKGNDMGRAEIFDSPVNEATEGPFGSMNYHGRALYRIHGKSVPRKRVFEPESRSAFKTIVAGFDETARIGALGSVGEFVRQDGMVLAFGTRGQAVDIATGELFKIKKMGPNGTTLSRRMPDPEVTQPWEPRTEEDLQRPYERILLVEEAFAEQLIPNSMLGPDGYIAEALDNEGLLDSLLDPSMSQQERQNARAVLKATMFGKTGMDAGLPLFIAAEADDADAIRRLVAEGADVDGRDPEGWTPLAEAARVNAPNAAKALIELGADLDLQTLLGHPPLMIALTRRHDATGLVLLNAGANIYLESAAGICAVDLYREGLIASPELVEWFEKAMPTD